MRNALERFVTLAALALLTFVLGCTDQQLTAGAMTAEQICASKLANPEVKALCNARAEAYDKAQLLGMCELNRQSDKADMLRLTQAFADAQAELAAKAAEAVPAKPPEQAPATE